MTVKKRSKKFTQETGSIDSRLNKMPKSVQRKYDRNRKKSEADARSLERWAAHGFSSYGDEVVHSEDSGVLG